MAWWIPLLIFAARVGDVSIGTMRTILVTNGYKKSAAMLGFFEVTIWVLAVSGVIQNLHSPWSVLAYAGGYATGVLVGMTIEERLALGYRVVRVISMQQNGNLCERLRAKDWRATRVNGHGRDGAIEIAFLAIPRRDQARLMRDVRSITPDAFITVERVERPHGANFGPLAAALRK